MVKNVVDNKVQCHLIPQGVMNQLYRSIGGKKPGLVTKVGLQTYVDPRVEVRKLIASLKVILVKYLLLMVKNG